METSDAKRPDGLDLAKLTFSAKVDYVTVAVCGKVPLPELDGKAIWSPRNHYKQFTVHDATGDDVALLLASLGDLRILELEVAVDLRPAFGTTESACDELLCKAMHTFAVGLHPLSAVAMDPSKRALYRRRGARWLVRPFNRVLPLPTDQLLYGFRSDPVQVKCYWKRTDQGKSLSSMAASARVEVRMGAEALALHSITTLAELHGFRFRKHLMQYFRHVRGTVRAVRNPDALLSSLDNRDWQKVGAGAFVPGGKRASESLLLARDHQVNSRIGQALLRLERSFRKANFVCGAALPTIVEVDLARLCGDFRQSPMTYESHLPPPNLSPPS